jgi:hypothetical protein
VEDNCPGNDNQIVRESWTALGRAIWPGLGQMLDKNTAKPEAEIVDLSKLSETLL